MVAARCILPKMRVVLLAMSVLAVGAEARCLGEWTGSFPDASVELPPEGQVLITLGGSWSKLEPSRDLEFVNGPLRVPVEVLSNFEGHRQRQVLLKAQRALAPGRWSVQVKKSVRNRPAMAVGSWKVRSVERPAPTFPSRPELGVLDYEELGCGPASMIPVQVRTAPGVMVEVALTVEGTTRVGVFPVKNGVVDLGHGMCSGGFDLSPGTKATVVLTPVDVSGARGAPSSELAFVAPGKEPASPGE